MAHFIKVADTEGSCDFIDLDKVTKISCAVERTKTGGGFNIESIADATIPKTSPVCETVNFIITLSTAGGKAQMHFSDSNEAVRWAKDHFGVDVPFDQI